MTFDPALDPKGLIKEAFAIEGIGAAECRSIFLDWALGLPPGRDLRADVALLIAHHGGGAVVDHPMLVTLQAALEDPPKPRRRGGRAARV